MTVWARNRIEALADEQDDPVMRIDFVNRRGCHLANAGRLKIAMSDFHEVIEVAPRICAPRLITQVRGGLAQVKRFQGRWNEASSDFEALVAEFQP